jgi:3-keto-L-gulonate-6-phosphate decarboxylase
MKRPACITSVFGCVLLFLAGCVSTPPGVTITSRAPADTTQQATTAFTAKRAWIFVEGMQQSATPATIVIRRSFEVTNVSLHVGADFEQVRRYEIERVVTANRRMLDYSFNGDVDGGLITFNAQELSRDKKGNVIIPFYDAPIQIIDHEYDLVLIVRE